MVKRLLAILLLTASCALAQNASIPNSGQITAATTNATCANNGVQNGGAVDQPVNQFTGAVGISVTGIWAATLNIHLTVDHGKTWTASGSTFTANQQSVISTAGNTDVCVFASAYTSGTAIVTFATGTGVPGGASGTGASSGQVQGCGPADAASVCNPVVVAGTDNAGNVQELPVADSGTAIPERVVQIGGSDTVNIHPIAVSNTGVTKLGVGVATTDGVTANVLDLSTASSLIPLPHMLYLFNGTTFDRGIYCSNTSTFSVASTVTQVIAASGSTKIRICSFDINPSTATAGSADIVYGTGANCGTGTTTLTGAYTLPAAAVVDITPSTLSSTSPLTTPASQAVCVRAVTSTVNGFIVWEQH